MKRLRLLCVLFLVFGGCDALKKLDEPKVMTSTDGLVSLTVPASFSKDQLNDAADLQAANRFSELYVIVLTEPKEDLAEMTLEKYSAITRQSQLKSMRNASEVGPTALTINGMPAIQYELHGSVDATNTVMLHTSVEGSDHYYQLLAWTLKSKWKAERERLAQITSSLTELKKKPAARPSAP